MKQLGEAVHELLFSVAEKLVDSVCKDIGSLILDDSLISLELVPTLRILKALYLLTEILQRHWLETNVLSTNTQVWGRDWNCIEFRMLLILLINQFARQKRGSCFR